MAGFDLADLYDNYDPDQIDTSKRGERPDPLPEGEYLVQAFEADLASKNDNVGLKIVFDVIGGEYEGRKIWEYLNIRHSNATAQKIAQEAYTELWRDALRIGLPKSTEDILFKPVLARVKITPAKDGYAAGNRIIKYLPATQSAPARSAPQQRAAASPAQASGNRPSFLAKR